MLIQYMKSVCIPYIEIPAEVSPRCGVLFEKLMVAQMIKKISAFCGTRRFISVFMTCRH